VDRFAAEDSRRYNFNACERLRLWSSAILRQSFRLVTVPGFSGAHSQGATLEELRANLREVIAMLLEDSEPETGGGIRRHRSDPSLDDGAFAGAEPREIARVLEKLGFPD